RLLRRGPAALRRGAGACAQAGRAAVPDVFQRRGTRDRGAAASVAAGVVRLLRRWLGGRIGRAVSDRDQPGGHRGQVLERRAEGVVRGHPADRVSHAPGFSPGPERRAFRAVHLLPRADPERRGPGQLAVLLLRADVVVVHPGLWFPVGPFRRTLAPVDRQGGHGRAVAEDLDLGQVAGADHLHRQSRGTGGVELVAHDVRPAADVANGVVPRPPAVPPPHPVQDRLAVVVLGQYDAVADVRGPVVARRLEAELVPLLGEGVIDESLREPAGDVERLLVPLRVVPGARGPLLL